MILRELRALHWCGIDEATFDLHPESNLVVGPNEAGKTRLFRALWFALLERSAGQSQARLALRDRGTTDPPDPRLRLTFERGGATWAVEKTFARAASRTSLERVDGVSEPHEGPEAEARLAELLGVEPPSGRKDRWQVLTGLRLWPLLFLRERAGHLPPASRDAAGEEAASFVRDLLRREAGAATLSPRGAATLDALTRDLAARLTPSGRGPKAGGPLHAAHSRWSTACEALTRVESTYRDVADGLARLTKVRADLTAARKERAALDHEAREAKAALTAMQVLEARRAQALAALREAERDLDDRARAVQERTQLAKELEQARDEVAKTQAELEREQGRLEAADEALRAAEKESARAREALHEARDERRRRALALEARRAGADLERARAGLARAEALAADLDALDAKIDAAADLTPAWLDQLQTLDDAARLAQVQVAGAAVQLRLTPARALEIDEDAAPPGEPRTLEISRPRTVHVRDASGEVLALEVRPGGEELLQLQAAADRAHDALRDALDAAGLEDLARARLRLREVEGWRRDRADAKARLDDLLEEAGCSDLSSLRAQVEALASRATPPDDDAPGVTVEQARDALARAEAQVVEAERAAEAAAARVAERGPAAQGLAQTCAALAARADALDPRVAALEQALAELPEDDALARELEGATRRHDEAAQAHATLDARWQEAGGDALERRAQGLTQDLEGAEARVRELELELARLRARVQEQTGGQDLERARAGARAAALAARRELLAERTRARALEELVAKIRAGREQAQAQMLAPLVAEAEADVRTILGGARLALDEHLQPTLRRDDTQLPHSTLSAGAQEQLALALRLALARILRRGLDEPLPLILDDPLTHTDPTRMEHARDMLRRAAASGLQIVLMTCDPAAYRGLGFARTIHL